jgi:cytochrome c biogenesis factor
MAKVFRLFRSIKVTLVLVSLLALGCALATMVPQGLAPDWYLANYHIILAELILFTGLYRFFVSPVFLVLVVLFSVNLFSCTIHRFARQLTLKRAGYYGPDILHAGILLLAASAACSAFSRSSASVELAAGEGAEFPGGVYVQVVSLQAVTHEDGRPKDWITTVRFAEPGREEWEK